MNSKSFEPENEEEKKFIEDTYVEISGLKTLDYYYIYSKEEGET